MSGALRKGWCPSLFEPMAAGDGDLVRVKPRVGGLHAAQLRAIAAAAARFGSGRVEITNRGNFQIRGLNSATWPSFVAAMQAAGLASVDPAAERRRNIVLPLGPGAAEMALAAALEDWLEQDATLAALPAKFGFSLGGVAADIGIVLEEGAALLMLPGGFAASSHAPLADAQALTRVFLQHSAALNPQPSRMAALVAAIGAAALFEQAGLWMQAGLRPLKLWPAAIGKQAEGFGLGLPFGALSAEQLHAAADFAERFGNGRIRTMSTRQLVLLGTGDAPARLEEEAAAQGFIVTPNDPALKIAACAGRPSCPSAFADARQLAASLAPGWRGRGLLHVSACAKGCACAVAAPATLVARAQSGRYDLVLAGRASDPPHAADISLAQAIQTLRERSLYA